MEPTSLQEAIVYFANPDNCREYVVARRWPNGVTCPTCGSADVSFLPNQNRWYCRNKHSQRQFSLKTGTIYEDSPLGLDKWLTATWLVINCKNGVSSCEVARALKITQKTAWFLDHRIRVSFGMESPDNLTGHVEADETFIGGKARNMHKDKRAERITGTGGKDKTAVMGILERGKDGTSKVRTTVVPNRKKGSLQAEYVEGEVHTNGLENFWSLLKRGINGTYVSVEPFHLFRYLDEQVYRFNNRKLTDGERFDIAVGHFWQAPDVRSVDRQDGSASVKGISAQKAAQRSQTTSAPSVLGLTGYWSDTTELICRTLPYPKST